MVKSLDEILAELKTAFGDNITDDVVRAIEDVNDTLSEYAGYKSRYDDLDRSWRTRYIERFGSSVQEEKPEEETEVEVKTEEKLPLSAVFEKEE